jgi:hypothetical protein
MGLDQPEPQRKDFYDEGLVTEELLSKKALNI